MREQILKTMLDSATKDKPITREHIMSTFLISDRKARAMIEALRESGIRVCGLSAGQGYWIAKTEEEYKRFRRDYVSKATTILRRAHNMDDETNEGQVTMNGIL